MMPKGRRVKSVNIYANEDDGMVQGFKFFYEDDSIFRIGKLSGKYGASIIELHSKVVLADNEVIIGVVCKLYPGEQSVYSDF